MKILALSNFYPPHHVSGYAMLCFDVLEALRARGHDIAVLTSTLGHAKRTVEGHVRRLLTLESPLDYYDPVGALAYPRASHLDVANLRRLVDELRPEVVFIWGMWNLSKRLAAESERLLPGRVVYYLANPWPIEPNLHRAYWAQPTRRPWLNWAKRVCRLGAAVWLREEWRDVPLRFAHAPCCSRALRDQLVAAGVPLGDAPVIYEGIDVDAYISESAHRTSRHAGDKLSLVYVGLLVEHKGVHTALEALSRLSPQVLERVTLTVLGSGHPDYEARLRNKVVEAHLSEVVSFASPIPRTELAGFLARHDVLVLPSTWEEPLALIMQEGLASGLVVVASSTGGTKEIVRDGENGLLFRAGDAAGLAAHIERLVDSPALCARLSANGRATALEKFSLRRMVDDLEAYLVRVSANPLPV